MDVIDRAIEKGYHVTSNHRLFNATWCDFEAEVKQKKVIVFGCGKGAKFFFHKYKEKITVSGFIDNDSNLKGCVAQYIIDEPMDEMSCRLLIQNDDYLNNCSAETTVVLIASIRFYQEIAENLEKRGFKSYFSVLCMEVNYRKLNGISNVEEWCVPSRPFWENERVPIDSKKLVLLTMCDGAGHGKELVEHLLQLRSDLKIVWIVRNRNAIIPEGVQKIYMQDWQVFHSEMSSAGMWIYDQDIPLDIIKRNGQICIILTHWPSVTLKMFGLDLANYRNDASMKNSFVQIGQNLMDYMIVGSSFDERVSRNAYGFNGRVFVAGSLRSDALFRSEICKENVLKAFNLQNENRYLLYAPTFRTKTSDYNPAAENIDLDYKTTKKALEQRFGGEWCIFLRLHPAVAKASKDISFPDYVIDVSEYYDSEELVAASDAMITDYSSIMFEPAFVHKPVFLLATDLEEYLQKERGFLMEYDSLPFPISTSNEELVECIKCFDEAIYIKNLEIFMNKYGVHEDGHAGERAAMFVSDLIDGKKDSPYLHSI